MLRTDGEHMAANMLKETLAKGLQENDILVKKDTNTRIVHIMGMDDITTKEGVIEAVKTTLNGKDNFIVTSLRPAYAETQNATIEAGQEEVPTLLSTGKIKIGWANCRIQERINPRRCFKC